MPSIDFFEASVPVPPAHVCVGDMVVAGQYEAHRVVDIEEVANGYRCFTLARANSATYPCFRRDTPLRVLRP